MFNHITELNMYNYGFEKHVHLVFFMIIFSDNDYISRIKMSYTNNISILLPFRGHLNLKCMHVDITIIIFMKMEKESQG